ncbi:hypothetical protein ASD66_11950 [Nocardioides sp. Root151]|nr:hypothetical protein ASD66_11950 [Nocardioides sp. Root151]
MTHKSMPTRPQFRRTLARSAAFGVLLVSTSLAAPSQAHPASATAQAPAGKQVAAQAPVPVSADAKPKSVAKPVTLEPLPPAWVLPVSGYHLTGTFGATSSLWSSTHTGLDFAAPDGTPIHSVTDGVVIESGWDGAYGNKTVVELADGTQLWYCHQNSITSTVGQELAAGDLLGYIGATGNVTGPHLHLEVRPSPDVPVDPFTALTEHGLHP